MPGRALSAVFGVLVREQRTELKLSQETLAERAGIHHTHVGLIERGARNASLDVAQKVADGLGIRLSLLIAEAERRLGSAKAKR
jgi:transcriptional regulator with XRE-family HTH domain